MLKENTMLERRFFAPAACLLTAMIMFWLPGFTLAGEFLAPHGTTNGPDFVSAKSSTAELAVLEQLPPSGKALTVTWSIVAVDNSANPAVVSGHQNKAIGLAWGTDAPDIPHMELKETVTSQTNASGIARIQLTDIVGERTVTVQASITVGGNTHTLEQRVSFGQGPLSVFRAPLPGEYLWASHSPINNDENAELGNFPAIQACGTALTAAELQKLPDGYHAATGLPSLEQFRSVNGIAGNGAWLAAGWPDHLCWTGDLSQNGSQAMASGARGTNLNTPVNQRAFPVVCLR